MSLSKREPKQVGVIIKELIRKGEILPSITKNVLSYGKQ